MTNLSQSGGFVTGEGTSVIDNTTHMALGANLSPAVENETESEIVARVVEQLIYYPLNVDSRFKSALPSPSVQDNSVACNGSGLSLPRSLLAPEQQPAGRINILYPLDGQKASPGEKVMVTVQPPANARLTTVLFLSQAGADIVERSPFQAEMEIPVDFVGGFPLLVAARDNTGRLHISRPVNLDVTHSATLISLSVGLARLSMRLGASFRLSVNGVYSDGVSRNLTPANTGTFYQSGNEQIIAVDRNGLVTARAEGETIILISNGQVDQVIKVKVGQ
ncbi:MAG: hypothetical protein HY650_15100 [Acidobacteria bacterium]|nr:hypothetical protein [Acidobacteriota bacterium]